MSRSSELHIGIDLGTTNSVITYLQDGRPVPIAIDGEAIVPSVVYVDQDGSFRVGREARNLQLSEPERTMRSVKRKMGLDHRYEIDGRRFSPEEIRPPFCPHSRSERSGHWDSLFPTPS